MKPKIVQISAIDVSMNNMLSLLNKRTKEAGYEVHCICSPGKSTNEISENGYHFHPVVIDRKISLVKNIKAIYDIYKVLKKVKPQIVHVHTPIASVLGRIAAKLAGVNTVIYTAHGFYFHDGMNQKIYKLFFYIEKLIGRYFTDFIFTQSEEDYYLAKDNNFLRVKENYLHISNGIDLNDKYNYKSFNPKIKKSIRETYNVNDEDLLITFIGRLVKEKGIIDLVKSFEFIHEKENIKIIVMGNLPNSERDQSISKEIHEIEIGNPNIIFTGRVGNVEDFLYASDVFILPSYREGMPRSIIEAMSMKNAIIATNIRGSREEVDNGKTGFLINLHSPSEIAEKIEILKKNPELLQMMKDESYKKAIELYDEEKVVSKQLEIFNAIVVGDRNE